LTALLPLSASAAEWRIDPSLDVSGEYAGNPRMTAHNEETIYGSAVNTAARIMALTEISKFELNPRLHFARYDQDAPLDADDRFLTASYVRQGERLTWETDAQVVHDTTLTSELGTTGFTQTNRRHELLDLSVTPQLQVSERLLVGATADWQTTHYVDARAAGLTDYEYRTGGLNAKFAWNERLWLTADAEYGQLVVPSADSIRTSETLRAGLEYELGLRWHASIAAGPSRMRSAFDEERGEVYSAHVSRKGERFQFGSTLSREVSPTGQGLLSTRDSLELTTQNALAEHCTLGLSVSALRTHQTFQAFGFTTPEVKYYNAAATLDWQVAREWFVSMHLTGSTQSLQTLRGVAEDSHGYRVSFGVSWRGDTWQR
jgi:hypothetical protein